MDCLFCKIGKGEIPSEVVYEDPHTLAFLDIHPRAPGHTVVISKFHSKGLIDLPDEEGDRLWRSVRRVTQAVEGALEADGFTIGINHGSVSGQTVDHLHVHILPRFVGDGGSSIHSVVSNPPTETLKEIGDKIRQSLA